MWWKLILPSASHAKQMDRAAGVHGNQTMNFPAPVPHTRLWVSCETLESHALNIFCHIFFGMYGGLKSFQTATSFQPRKAFSLAFFLFVLRFIQKLTQPTWYKCFLYELMANEILIFKIKKIIALFFMLPSCSVILSNPPRNIIICSIPLKFSLALKILKK